MLDLAVKGVPSTAFLVAKLRASDAIPYSVEIASKLTSRTETNFEKFLGPASWLRPFVLVRHLSIDALLDQRTLSWVVELASGLTPRGLKRSQGSSVDQYFEADIKEMIEIKKYIINSLKLNSARLYFHPFDAKSKESWMALDEVIPKTGSGAIVVEGLLQYFSKIEIKNFFRNLREFMSKRTVVLISSDFPLRQYYDLLLQTIPEAKSLNSERTKVTGVDIYHQAFKSSYDREMLFDEMGFVGTEYHQMDLTKGISAIEKPSLEFLPHLSVFELAIK